MVKRHEFSEGQVEAAIAFVVEHGAHDRASTISYSRVFEAAGLPPPRDLHQGGESELVTLFMGRFHHCCREQDLPPLDALVVHVAGPRQNFPGVGYFTVNGLKDPLDEKTTPTQATRATTCWEDQKKKCGAWGVRHRRGQI
jgi:hypothetical protein